MSYLKISDPAKRDSIVKDYLQTRERIKNNQLQERLDDQFMQRELTKVFKPVTDTQLTTTSNILEELKPKQKALTYPTLQAIEEPEVIPPTLIGPVAQEYLRKHASTTGSVDRSFGIYDKNGQFYIGNTPVTIVDDNIRINDEDYQGTPGLWELITMKNPSQYTDEDYDNYAKILKATNAMRQKNDPANPLPKASKSDKWKNIIKPIWEGRGVTVIPSDPNALMERFDLLMASKNAGNSGVRNELVSICDELKRQGVISDEWYKNIMLRV